MDASGYELWDRTSRNLMGSYNTQEEALRVMFDEVRLQGHAYVDSIVLLRVGPRGGLTRIAAGAELLKRALAAFGEPSPRTSVPSKSLSPSAAGRIPHPFAPAPNHSTKVDA